MHLCVTRVDHVGTNPKGQRGYPGDRGNGGRVQLHYFLHGFHAGRGKGEKIIELKLAQELASVDQEPPFLLFLYLRKAYKNLERERLLQILAGYRAEPKLHGLLEEFWARQEVVTCQNGFNGLQL